MSTTDITSVDPSDLETLIGEARDHVKILSMVISQIIESAEHREGSLVHPLNSEDEQAVVFATILANEATRALYNRFHRIEVGGAS